MRLTAESSVSGVGGITVAEQSIADLAGQINFLMIKHVGPNKNENYREELYKIR